MNANNSNATTTAPKPRRPKLTDQIPAEEIMSPEPRPFVFKGQTFDILPVPDSVLQTIIDQLTDCVAVILGAAGTVVDATDEASEEPSLTLRPETLAQLQESIGKRGFRDYVRFIPQIAEVLLPNSTKIVAAALASADMGMLGDATASMSQYRRRVRVSEDWVDDNLFRHQRLEALELIIEAENIPALMARFEKLVAKNWGATPA